MTLKRALVQAGPVWQSLELQLQCDLASSVWPRH